MLRTQGSSVLFSGDYNFMCAKKTIGAWERDPISRQNIYFVTYCATCGDKIYVTDWQLQQLIDNTYFHHSKFWVIIRNMVKMRVPKVHLEWGNSELWITPKNSRENRGFNKCDTSY